MTQLSVANPSGLDILNHMNCKYCGSNIKWIDRKPFNLDNTPHTFDYCQSKKKSLKAEAESILVDELFQLAKVRIEENNKNLEDPNYIYVKTRLKPPVATITKEKAKVSLPTQFVAGSVHFQGTLTNGAKCLVWVNQNGEFAVNSKGTCKKNKELFEKCWFDATLGEGNWGVKHDKLRTGTAPRHT
jgi:hypothetical protein